MTSENYSTKNWYDIYVLRNKILTVTSFAIYFLYSCLTIRNCDFLKTVSVLTMAHSYLNTWLFSHCVYIRVIIVVFFFFFRQLEIQLASLPTLIQMTNVSCMMKPSKIRMDGYKHGQGFVHVSFSEWVCVRVLQWIIFPSIISSQIISFLNSMPQY